MTEAWLDVTIAGETRRHPLRKGLTRVGGPGADVEVPDAGSGQLHVWDDPPKVVRVGDGPPLEANGSIHAEVALRPGDRLRWGAAELVYGGAAVVIEELPEEPAAAVGPASAPAVAAPAPGAAPAPDVAPRESANARRAWQRLQAGLFVELGLADKSVKKRWQSVVLGGEWDADACAREVNASAEGAADDPRFLERAGRLQRDLLMADFQRGMRRATRSARGAARSGTAFLIANLIGIACYSAVVVALLVLVRVKYDWSLDEVIDGFVDAITPG